METVTQQKATAQPYSEQQVLTRMGESITKKTPWGVKKSFWGGVNSHHW